MALVDLHLAKLAGLVLAALAVFHILTRIHLASKRRALAREKGCLPPPLYPQPEQIFGWSLFRQNMRSLKQRKFLESSANRFREMGVNTYQLVALGRRLYTTIEPENLKTIQAVDFKKWGLGERRKISFRPLLGDGKPCLSCRLSVKKPLTFPQAFSPPTAPRGNTLARC